MSNDTLHSSPATSAVAARHANDAPGEELDREDRRWQLEWARRNIED
jgi:hypothetical protein